ncbi:hypothetical protein OROHE_013639 [Orobanche hederae]
MKSTVMENQAVSSPPPTPADTVIQADAATFKDLVQKLTGAQCSGTGEDFRLKAAVPRRSRFKLRNSWRKHSQPRELDVELTGNSTRKTRSNQLISWSVEGHTTAPEFESAFGYRVETVSRPSESEKEMAIPEKGSCMHASPWKTETPVLLTLFPLTSPNYEI